METWEDRSLSSHEADAVKVRPWRPRRRRKWAFTNAFHIWKLFEEWIDWRLRRSSVDDCNKELVNTSAIGREEEETSKSSPKPHPFDQENCGSMVIVVMESRRSRWKFVVTLCVLSSPDDDDREKRWFFVNRFSVKLSAPLVVTPDE